jgi:hypothetical protein
VTSESYKVLPRATLLLLLLGTVCVGQNKKDSPAESGPQQASKNIDVNHVISVVTASENEFRAAFGGYGYKYDVIVQTFKDGKVTGEYRRTTQVALDKKGKLEERVLYFPRPSVTDIQVTREDLEDLSGRNQFILQTVNISKYNFKYAGNERIDNIDLYVFDVEPKVISSRERLFSGRIWLRANDLRILRMRGRSAQNSSQRFPVLDSYRAQVGEHCLFPALAVAEETLEFPFGRSVHLRIEVRYSDYVKLK